MRLRVLLLWLLLLGSAHAQQITNCTVIGSPGYYSLVADISSTDTCIQIVSGDVVLDGKGYSITGSNLYSTYGILVGGGEFIYNITVKNLSISGFESGIYSIAAVVEITNCSITWSLGDGIRIENSNFNTVAGNRIAHSGSYGISLAFSDFNTLYDNKILNSTAAGIFLDSSENTIFNNFFNNSLNVEFGLNHTNYWNTTLQPGTNIVGGSYIGGNFWADPSGSGFSENCIDGDADGICDISYVMNSNNTDYLPLAFPSDITPPQIVVHSPQNTTYATGSVVVNVSATDTSGIDSVVAELDGFQNITLSFASGYYTGTLNLSDGSHEVVVYATDIYGNTNSSSVYFTVGTDTTPPGIFFIFPTPPPGAAANISHIFINTTSDEPLTGAKLEWNGTNYTMLGSGNNWYRNVTGLAEGIYTYRVYGTDAAGNTNSTGLMNVTIDFTPPVTEDDSPAGWQNKSFTVNLTCYDAFSGCNTTYYRVDGGTWKQGNSVLIAEEGNHTVEYYSLDTAGNAEGVRTAHVALDITPPAVAFVSPTPANGSSVSVSYVYVNITASEALSKALLEWNGANTTMICSGKSCYLNNTGLANGDYEYRVYAIDYAGNMNVSEPRVVTVNVPLTDTLPPTITLYSPQNTTYSSASVALNVSADEPVESWWYSLNGGANTTFTPNTTITGSEGGNHLVVYARDTSGNVGSAEVYFSIDTTPPAIAFAAPTPVSGSLLRVSEVFINTTSSEPLSQAVLEWNGANITMKGSGKNWHANLTNLSSGVYTFRVYGRDTAGNWNSTEVRTVNISLLAAEDNYILRILIATSSSKPGNESSYLIHLRIVPEISVVVEERNYRLYLASARLMRANRTDMVPPHIAFVSPTPANASTINTSHLFVNVTSSEPLSQAVLEWKGTNITMKGSRKNWYLNLTHLSSGVYNFRVYGRDLAGNWNHTEIRTVNISLPVVRDSYILSIRIITGSSNAQAENIAILQIRINSRRGVVVEEGSYRLYLTTSKLLRANRTDLIPPEIALTAPTPANGSVLNLSYVVVNITSSKPLSKAVVEWNGVNITMKGSGRSWYANLTNLSSGIYNFRVYGRDMAGNWNTTEARTLNVSLPAVRDSYLLSLRITTAASQPGSESGHALSLSIFTLKGVESVEAGYTLRLASDMQILGYPGEDTSPPDITLISPENTTYTSGDVVINASVRDNTVVDKVVAEIDGSAKITLGLQKGYYTGTASGLADGRHWIRINSIDIHGNTNSTYIYFTVDTSPPEIKITNPVNGTSISLLNNSVEGSLSDLSGVENVSLYLDGVYIASWSHAGNFSRAVNYTRGWHNITLTAVDTLNNTAVKSLLVYVNPPSKEVHRNITANKAEHVNAKDVASMELELASRVNDSVKIVVNASTNASELGAKELSAYAAAHSKNAIDKFVKVELNGTRVNGSANLSYVVIRLYYTLADLDKNGDGDASDPGDIDPTTLHLFRFCSETNTWEEIPHGSGMVCGNVQVFNSSVNLSGKYVWANLSRLSVYGIAGSVIAQPASAPPSYGGGSGGGAALTGYGVRVSRAEKGEYTEVSLEPEKAADIYEVEIKPKMNLYNAWLRVEEVKKLPSYIAKLKDREVYRYLKLSFSSSALAEVKIRFRVNVSWLESKDINPAMMKLLKYDGGKWQELDTKKLRVQDGKYILYEAVSPGFSYFAIAGEPGSGFTLEEKVREVAEEKPQSKPLKPEVKAPEVKPEEKVEKKSEKKPAPGVEEKPAVKEEKPEKKIFGICGPSIVALLGVLMVLIRKKIEKGL